MQAEEEKLFLFFEMFFADAAGWAGPVIGDFFEWGTGCYACVGVTCLRVINPTAYYADIS